jgi:hypothetical protein
MARNKKPPARGEVSIASYEGRVREEWMIEQLRLRELIEQVKTSHLDAEDKAAILRNYLTGHLKAAETHGRVDFYLNAEEEARSLQRSMRTFDRVAGPLDLALPPDDAEATIGDLEEQYGRRLAGRGQGHANRWLFAQVLRIAFGIAMDFLTRFNRARAGTREKLSSGGD